MRRRLIGLLALALLAAACTAGGGGSDQPAATIDPNANHAPLTLTRVERLLGPRAGRWSRPGSRR